MSQDELHVGKLTPINTINIEDYCKQICIKHNIQTLIDDSYYRNSYLNIVLEELYDMYIYHNNTLYFIEDIEYSDNYIEEYTKNEDESINYICSFYNGGCCLHERLYSILDEVNNK